MMNEKNITVLYDGGCPLCSREIAHYRRLDRDRAMTWIDVSDNEVELGSYGISREQAMALFHVYDADGAVHTGVRGFLLIWQALPRYRWLATGVQCLHLLSLLDWCYRHFAAWHFRRRCSAEACVPPSS